MLNNFSYFLILLTILNLFIYFIHDKLYKFGVPYDYPDKKRKFHTGSILISGGVIFFINLIFLIIYLELNKFTAGKDYTILRNIYLFALIFFIFGFMDDKFNLNPWIKFILMILLLLILFTLDKSFLIKELKFSFTKSTIYLGNYSIITTLLCYLLFINAFNMFDGINLQSSIFSISLILFYLIVNFMFELNLLILPSLLLFIFLNFKNKSFLGDGGCYLLSFIFGSYAIIAYNNSIIPYCDIIFILMILPGLDMLRLFIKRISNKRSPFASDRDHFHHILLKNLNYNKTIFIILLIIILNLFLLISKIDSRLILLFFVSIYFYLILKFRN